MTQDERGPEVENKLKRLAARLRAANRAKGRPNPSARRRRVNYRRRLKEARKILDEGDRETGLLLLESLDNDYPSVDSIAGRPIRGGRFGGGAASGGDWGDVGGGDAGGGGS